MVRTIYLSSHLCTMEQVQNQNSSCCCEGREKKEEKREEMLVKEEGKGLFRLSVGMSGVFVMGSLVLLYI